MMFLLVVLLALGVLLAIVVWFLYQREVSAEPLVPASQVQNISSPDGKFQAVIRSRPDSTFQVEVRRRGVNESETGPTETWTLFYGPAITASLEEAVEIANQQVMAVCSE